MESNATATPPHRGETRDRGISRWREARLVRAARRGDERALAELFAAHWTRCHRAAYLICHDASAAEDIAQEAFLAAIRRLDRFDYRRPLAPWLHRIVVNRAIDYARAAKLRPVPTEAVADRPSESQGAAAELSDELIAAIGALDPERRALVVLRHLLEFTPSEIAGLMELPRGTVNSRLRRALDQLRDGIEAANG